MHCPRYACCSDDVQVIRTYNHNSDKLAKKYHGLNVVRRGYRCQDCGYAFYTVEITEDMYETQCLDVRRDELSPVKGKLPPGVTLGS